MTYYKLDPPTFSNPQFILVVKQVFFSIMNSTQVFFLSKVLCAYSQFNTIIIQSSNQSMFTCILKGALPHSEYACVTNFNDNVLVALLPKVLSAMSTQVSSLLVIS